MRLVELRPWSDPRRYARAVDPGLTYWALLYSGVDAGFTGGTSILALDPRAEIAAASFESLDSVLTMDAPRFANAWFGWATYELAATLEQVPVGAPSAIPVHDLHFLRYGAIVRFDHRRRQVAVYAEDPAGRRAVPGRAALAAAALRRPRVPAVSAVATSLDRFGHASGVERILRAIHAGDLYQANLTRRITGALEPGGDHPGLALFLRLARLNPAPYAAYLRHGPVAAVSSSPERFLAMTKSGRVESRPIKGTEPRFTDRRRDAAARRRLAASAKDRAENLMIVDLVRNDLGRVAVPGSVTAERRYLLQSHATVHHLSSVVSARRLPDVSPLEVVCACFPPGSMTGAPKIAAISHCAPIERVARGIYSGALGWFGGDGSADLSVVIRTIVVAADRFELGIGGGIVADSEPDAEWQETEAKASALKAALGITSAGSPDVRLPRGREVVLDWRP